MVWYICLKGDAQMEPKYWIVLVAVALAAAGFGMVVSTVMKPDKMYKKGLTLVAICMVMLVVAFFAP